MFGVKIPKLKKYAGEKPATALRIIRSHIGGMAGQLSTILVTLGQLGAQLDRIEADAQAAREYATIAARADDGSAQ